MSAKAGVVSLSSSARPAGTWIFLTGILFVHTMANILWLGTDNRPPLWDMALHQTKGLAYLAFLLGDSAAESWLDISGAYPPLYHHLLAAAFLVGRDSDTAVWANVPASCLLVAGTYLLGRLLFTRFVGLLASLTLLAFPYMAWMSRETILDYHLSAMVLWALVCIAYSDGFQRRSWSVAFGVFLALTALTKWIGPLFLVGPVIYAWCRGSKETSIERLRNLADGLILSGVLSLWWYLPKIPEIVVFLRQNTRVGAAEGEPPVLTFQSLIYYLRLLEGVQLQALFFVLAVGGAMYCAAKKRYAANFLGVWILSGYVGLTVLRTKDPRFTMPYLPAVALLCVSWTMGIHRGSLRKVVGLLLVLLAVGQFYLVSFGAPFLPDEIILMKGYEGGFSWDWKLLAQNYFGLLGPPVRETWPHDAIFETILAQVPREGWARLGVVPDFPRFNHENLRLWARLKGYPVDVFRLSRSDAEGRERIEAMDFLVLSVGDQGMQWSTASNPEINQYILDRPERFRIEGFASLPAGHTLRIYRVYPQGVQRQ